MEPLLTRVRRRSRSTPTPPPTRSKRPSAPRFASRRTSTLRLRTRWARITSFRRCSRRGSNGSSSFWTPTSSTAFGGGGGWADGAQDKSDGLLFVDDAHKGDAKAGELLASGHDALLRVGDEDLFGRGSRRRLGELDKVAALRMSCNRNIARHKVIKAFTADTVRRGGVC
jgi:hypothetical protein